MSKSPKQKPGRSFQAYGTPDDFLSAVRKRLGIEEFAIDVAASASNAVALAYYDVEANGLEREWSREGWNWCNPPFAHIEPWVCRAYNVAHERNTAVLVPAGVGSNWWRNWVHGEAMALLLNGRLTFKGTPVNPKTGKVDGYPKDCALLLYGPYVSPGYDVWTWTKDIVE